MENIENTNRRGVFSAFLECSKMSGVFYHSAIHGLGFFICGNVEVNKKNPTLLSSVNAKYRDLRIAQPRPIIVN